MNYWKKLQSIDPRYFQILFLGSFLIYGRYVLNWQYPKNSFEVVFGLSILVQYIAIRKYNLKLNSILSAIISSLGLLLLLRTNTINSYILGTLLIIIPKFLIRFKNKHIFNPVNLAIIVCVLVSNECWISPGQWGTNGIYLLIAGVFSLIVLQNVKQFSNGIIFIGTLGILEFIYLNLYLGWPIDYWYHKFSNGALLLFAFFMITDPRTTPNYSWARNIWSFFIALSTFIAWEFYYFKLAPFYILFFATLLVPILNVLFSRKDFNWNNKPSNSLFVEA